MLTAKLILERLSKEGQLLERREKLSRSFVLQLMDFLYLKHAQADRATRDIDNTLRTLEYDPIQAQQSLLVASPGGHAGYVHPETEDYRHLEGQDIGIQVGRGDTAVTPTDYKMADRIEHGRCGKAGAKADFLNPSFETGDLTNWTPASSANMEAIVRTDAWAIRDGTYYCALWSTANWLTGEYAQVSQDIDLTNITHFRFQLRGEGDRADYFIFQIFVDERSVYSKDLYDDTDYPNQLADVCAYTGVHTVTFKCIGDTGYTGGATHGAWIDNIETLQYDPEIEYGGTELVNLTFADPDGEFTIRRYFTNNSGQSITVEEVGIQAAGGDTTHDAYAFLIARDVVSPGVAVADGEILRVTYVPQITV